MKDELPATYFINPKSLVTYNELSQILKISKRTIRRLIVEKKFPEPVQCTRPTRNLRQTRKFWVYQDIIKYIDILKTDPNFSYENEIQNHSLRDSECFGKEQSQRAMRVNIKRWK